MDKTRFLKISLIAAVCLLSILVLSSCTGIKSSSDRFSDPQWTVIGPYDEPQRDSCRLFSDDLLTASGGESAISETGLPDDTRNIVHINARNGNVDFTRAYPSKNWAVVYAYLEFEGNGEECFFRMGSDDGLRVWINGVLVVDDHSHRALDVNSNSFRTVLKNGTNRILVKVCQGEEAWEFSLRETTRAEHEAFLSKSGSINLYVSSRSNFIGGQDSLAFSVLANHAPLTDIPFSYHAYDSGGNTIASGKGSLCESITVPLPSNNTEYVNIEIEAETDNGSSVGGRLGQKKIERLFYTGDPDTVLPTYSSKARMAAETLSSSSSWTRLKGDEQKQIEDMAPTLLYLADMIEGKLRNITVSEEQKVRAVSYVNDILNAMEKGPKALLNLTGYRQMAYRSDIDDSIQPYSLYLPESYSSDRKYSLAVLLHGYSGNDFNYGNTLASLMPDDFIILSVFGRGDLYYQSVGEQDVLDVMDRVINRYSVDENRVYITGSSMGGLGTWRIGSLYADRFAAMAPFCGWNGYELLENLGNMKTYIVHGNADDTVPIMFDKNCAEKLKKLGYDVSFVEIENGSHNAFTEWSRIYPPETLLDIFRSAERNPSPARLAATIPQVRYGRHYWITVDELDTSGDPKLPEFTIRTQYDSLFQPLPAPGRFEANRSDDGSITIGTERINALSIDLKTAGMINAGTNTGKSGSMPENYIIQIKKIIIDGTSVDVPANTDVLHLVKQKGNTWVIDGSYGNRTLPTHEGGGIADLFTKPLIIVYGTQDQKSAQLLEAAARSLADWSPSNEIPIGMKTGIFTVKSDTELTDEDMLTRNLILFGTPEENLISKWYSDALEPYYSGGDIYVSGKRYTRNVLYVTLPNPQAPGRLLGYIDCTRCLTSAESAKQYFSNFQFRLRNSYINELMGYPAFCPDIFIMTSHPFQDEWTGWFDRNWELN